MSGPERPASASTPAPAVATAPSSLKREDVPEDQHKDLDALDAIFKRIRVAVPRTPYVLSTPSLLPYHHHSRQEAQAWMLGHLWQLDEESQQYRTFLYREPCQDCFELQAGEDHDHDPEPEPDHQPAKRKLDLSAFKVKHANGSAAAVTQPNSTLATSKYTPTTQLGPGHTAAIAKAPKQQVNGHKRGERRTETPTTGPIQHSEPRPRPSAVTPTTRPKSSSVGSKTTTTTTATTTANATKSNTPSATPHGLPPMLSPVQEPFGLPHGLPAILSPTLPPTIQAELDRLDMQRQRAVSNALSSSSSDRKRQDLAVPTAIGHKPDGPLKTENRIRTVSANVIPSIPSPVRPGPQPNRTLLVKLKFSKAKAATVKSLLRLPPKKKSELNESHDIPSGKSKEKESVPVMASEARFIKKKQTPRLPSHQPENPTSSLNTNNTTSTSSRPTPVTAKVSEKRPRVDEDSTLAVPSKRPRALSQQDRPITPVPASSSFDPSNKPSSAQKNQSQYLTPKKDMKGTGMLRTASSESYDSTPGRSGTTPAGARADTKVAPTSAPFTGRKQADISLFSQTSMRLNQMGRSLKHEATKILTAGGKIDNQAEKRAAVINLECILSYMAAYYAQDLSLHLRNRPGEVEQTWKTLLPLCLSYARCTKDFPHLDGLRSYLSSIIASAICTHVAQRSANPLAHDSPQDIAHAELAKQHTSIPEKIAENFALLADHTLKMSRHFHDARITLPLQDLQSQYKKTWGGREINVKLAREPEKTSAANMSGPYFLPLGMDTSPIQAVRFGLRFLSEYCEKEGIEYRLRVQLERPE